MAKQDAPQVKKLTSHVKKLISRYKPQEPPATDPVVQLVLALLNWNATAKSAEQAYDALMAEMVDINELRVSPMNQLLGMLDTKYPDAQERLLRISTALHEVYVREHAVTMASVASKPKKDQRQYLDTLPGVPPYAAAQVMLVSFNGHAMPVDDKLLALLTREGCLEEGLSPAEAESFLMRHIKAADALAAHLAMQAWSDACKMPADAQAVVDTTVVSNPVAPPKDPPAKAKASQGGAGDAPKKKTTKKAAASKRNNKKVTKKK